MKNIYFYETEIGKIGIAQNENAVTNIYFKNEAIPKDIEEKETPLIKKTAMEIKEYLAGERKYFDIPIEPEGTEFQRSVWNALKNIPYGETRSYKDIAEAIGNPKAFRAVGMANNKNPIMIIIPCHRVIGASGSLIGYAGGLDVKEKLLKLEKE